MASKNFSGVLRDPLGTLANNDKYRFTHVSTTGEVIRGSTSYLTIGDDGVYDIDIEYGNVSIESYSELGRRWIVQGTTTINADTVATTLPALLNALVPASDALILQLEALLADAESAADRAETAASDIKRQFTTSQLINSDLSSLSIGDVVTTQGFSSGGDGGGAQWLLTSETGTPSQTPSELDDLKLTDSGGRVWELVMDGYTYNAEQIGGKAALPIGAQGTESSYKLTSILSDTVDQTLSGNGKKVNGYKVRHIFGGSSTKGGRHGMYSILVQSQPTAEDNQDRNYVALQGHIIASNNGDGGSVGAYKGGYFGISSSAQCPGTAQGILNVTGAEINTVVIEGATVKLKTGIQVVSGDGVFADVDAGYYLSKKNTATGYTNGFMISDFNGGFPVPEQGNLFYAGSAGNAQYTVINGIDFDNINFTGSILRTNNYKLSGTGSVEIGSLSEANIITTDYHTSGNNIDYDYRVQYSGGNDEAGGGVALYIGASLFKGVIRPIEDNTYTLGTNAFRYSSVYTNTINVKSLVRMTPLSSAPGASTGNIAVDNGSNWSGVNATGSPRPVFYDGTTWVPMF